MNEKRGRGRPAIPADQRRRNVGISLSPDDIELLQTLPQNGESQGELVARLLRLEARRQRRAKSPNP